jgi:hypothetical protein
MADEYELAFDFEELSVAINGKTNASNLWAGVADLDGDDDGFSVVAITLEGETIYRKNYLAAFNDELFKRISAVIENPKTAIGREAKDAWDDMRRSAREDAHDAYQSAKADAQRDQMNERESV